MTKTLDPNPMLAYQQTPEEVVARLGNHLGRGLNSQEAQTRLAAVPDPISRCFGDLALSDH